MRLAVLDIGSNTGHLLVVDAHRGAAPLAAHSIKRALRLSEHIDASGKLDDEGVTSLIDFAVEATRAAEDKGCESVLAFATSAIRDATNGEKTLAAVRKKTDLELQVLSGTDEARLTFLAVRRWLGWNAGKLLVFDIGGGSLEIAAGADEAPDVAQSLALGAARLTRDWLRTSPPKASDVAELRSYVRTGIAREAGAVLRLGDMDSTVATSKTFRSLARICGAAPSGEGPRIRRVIAREALTDTLPSLVSKSAGDLAKLPGVSANRAHQMVAGALVADAVMDLFEIEELEICPWALREGLILSTLDTL
ncbi:MAG: Ppx/GppA family phosphatase [Kineosporiaceae bacterium]|nr:Ppx/GppA family phosphatase [Kineosporiaceae bacterium]